MVSITLSVPDDVKQKMDKFTEMNWSGFIRKEIIEKTEELSRKEQLLKQLKKEKDIVNWSVKLQKKSRSKRFEQLKKKDLL